MSKLLKNRKSILTDDLSKCIICGANRQELHEIYFGKNRYNSIIWDCVAPLCYEHHRGNNGVHHNHQLDLYLKQICQKRFQELHPDIDFRSIFYKSYIK